MILSNYTQFIDKIYEKLSALGINSDEIKIDHIGYQADSHEDYDNKLLSIQDAKQLPAHIVGGRRVGVLILNSPLNYKGTEIPVIEIFEPTEGQQVNSDWEHVEFLVNGTLEEYMAKYPNINWDTSKLNRNEFPMLILSLGDGLRAKFPRLGVLEESKRQESGTSK